MLSARRYVLHFSLHHRWVCFLELSGVFLGKHLTQICIKAIFDFFFWPLNEGEKGKRTYFFEYFLFTVSQTMTYIQYFI